MYPLAIISNSFDWNEFKSDFRAFGRFLWRIGWLILAFAGMLFVFALVSRAFARPRPETAPGSASDPITVDGVPRWYREAHALIGLREAVGKQNNPEVVKLYAEAGHSGIKQDSVSWCAAFVCAMLERAGVSSPKTLLARDFLKWGKEVSAPKPGDIVVFWRGKPNSWQGHVGFYVRETKTYVYCLGGNQSDSVSIARYPKSRVLGYRRPRHILASKTVQAGAAAAGSAAGTAGAIAIENLPQSSPAPVAAPSSWVDVLTGVETALRPVAAYSKYIAIGLAIVSAAAGVYVVYERLNIRKATGR